MNVNFCSLEGLTGHVIFLKLLILSLIFFFMFKNYLKTAYRSLLRYKGATLIKLTGLALGMACCMLIVVYINDELSYNRFNTNYRDVYRVNFIKHGDGENRIMANTPITAGAVIVKDLPQVASTARLYQRSGILERRGDGGQADMRVGGGKVGEQAASGRVADGRRGGEKESGGGGVDGLRRRFQEEGVYFADNGLFDIFTIHVVQGSAVGALEEPNSIVLTREMARKYFGEEAVVGRSLIYENSTILRVTAVVDKLPPTSDVQFDALVSFETLYTVEPPAVVTFLRNNWLYNPTQTYIRMRPGQVVAPVEALLRQMTRKYGDERVQRSYYLSLQPLAALHLYASDVEDNPSTNSITYIYIFSAIAILILFIANINFINLSNAQALTRTAEIGIRKVSGASGRQLLLQSLGEALLLSGLAFLVAMSLTLPGLHLLNDITGKDLHAGVVLNGRILLLFVLLLLVTGMLGGFYPALFVLKFRLTDLLKGKPGRGVGAGGRVRASLIVLQFVIAISLITGAMVIQRQLYYLRNKPLGFDKEQLVVLPLFGKNPSAMSSGVDGPLRARMNGFENDVRSNQAVRAVTLSSVMPGDPFVLGLVIPEGHVDQDNIFVPWASVDYDFVQTINTPLVAGRDFSKASGTDHLQAFLINESAVRTFGWKNAQDAIGRNIIRGDSKTGKKGHVIGVIKDFNFGRLDRPQEPLILDVNVPRFTTFAIRVRPDRVPATLDAIRRLWDHYFPERVFEYSFLDENINALYKAQENLSKLVGGFAFIAIFICCIGLFSLASFMAVQRTREMGIRKVLGATVANITGLLFRDFFRLLVIALLIAIPLAWWLMNKWLHDFAYRIDLAWWIFAIAGFLAMFIAFLTVGMQGIRVARVNIVKSLRNM